MEGNNHVRNADRIHSLSLSSFLLAFSLIEKNRAGERHLKNVTEETEEEIKKDEEKEEEIKSEKK